MSKARVALKFTSAFIVTLGALAVSRQTGDFDLSKLDLKSVSLKMLMPQHKIETASETQPIQTNVPEHKRALELLQAETLKLAQDRKQAAVAEKQKSDQAIFDSLSKAPLIPNAAKQLIQDTTSLNQSAATKTGNGIRDQMLKKLDEEMDQQHGADAGQVPSNTRQPAAASQPPTATVIVMDGTTSFDPSPEAEIMQMAIPDSVKREILKNYRRTGVMPRLPIGNQ